VREAFGRYAGGGWSLRSLAYWMNTDPACPPAPKEGEWTICNVQYMLRNPVYTGRIRYHRSRLGYYDTSAPGSERVYQGRHEALIDRETFDRVQRRLDAARSHDVRVRLPRPLPIGVGLFVCAVCGGRMAVSRCRDESSRRAMYVCQGAREGTAQCGGRGYVCDVAHEGLLAQIGRLQGHPWQPAALDRLLAANPRHDERAELARALDDANAEMRQHMRRFTALIQDPTPQEVAAHRAIGREIGDRIAAHEAAIAALPAGTVTTMDLAALHGQFTRVSPGDQAAALAAAGNHTMLRELVAALVAGATVIDRIPEVRSSWVRVAVTWAPDVQTLLDAGLLTLAPDVDRPEYPATAQARQRARYLRYAARKKAGLVGA